MKRILRATLAVCLLGSLLAPASPAHAELGAVEDLGNLDTLVGSGVLLSLYDSVERVALADETIARAQIISPQEVLFTGLEPGRTTVFLWLVDHTRLRYQLHVERDLDHVFRALEALDSSIVTDTSADGSTVVLRGEVADRRAADLAAETAQRLLEGQATVLSLLRYPGYGVTAAERFEAQLARAIEAIDPRIRVRRIQVGEEADPSRDTVVLEGRVRTIHELRKAITLAERQLGGSGSKIVAAGDETLRHHRFRGFFGASGGTSQGSQALQGSDRAPSGLTAKVARGLVLTSESGRVLSFLEVDEIPQIMVSIRVVEVDRAKAKRLGVNWGYEGEHFTGGSALSPQTRGLPTVAQPGSGRPVSVLGDVGVASNLVGAFVDQMTSVVAAIDFLEDKALARSVAEPNVLTLSGEPATVVVGGEVPIPSTTVNQVTAVQGFFFQDFGVRLDIRPTAVEGDLISLEVSPSIVRPTSGLGNGEVPGFTVQSVQTTARVQAGQSLVLGGLLTFDEGLDERRIPGLGWIPGLGRWRKKVREQRELLFIISPRMVETPRSQVQAEPVRMPDLSQVRPSELEFPEGERGWRSDFEPSSLREDGVPPAFLPEGAEAPPRESNDAAQPTMTESADDPAKQRPRDSDTDLEDPELVWDDEAEPAEAFESEVDPAEPENEELSDEATAQTQRALVDASPCLHLREDPSPDAASLECIPTDTAVEILGQTGSWSRVRFNDREGWMDTARLLPLWPEEDPAEAAAALQRETAKIEEELREREDADRQLEEELQRLEDEIEDAGGDQPAADSGDG